MERVNGIDVDEPITREGLQGVEEAVLSASKENETARAELIQVPCELAADRSASPGDEHRLVTE